MKFLTLLRHRIVLFIAFIFFILLMLLISPIQRLNTTEGLKPATHSSDNSVIISIWNLHNQTAWTGNDNNDVISQQFSETSFGQSDLIALQEVRHPNKLQPIVDKNGFQLYGKRDAILAKKPVINSGFVTVNQEGRTAFWADIQVSADKTLRLYSVHLSFKIDRSPFIAEIRGEEMAALIKHSENFQGAVVIAGDYNTLSLFSPDFSKIPVFSKLHAAGYKSARPLGACNSQIPLGEQDWIFFKNASGLRYVCGNYAGSDHRWMQAEIELN